MSTTVSRPRGSSSAARSFTAGRRRVVALLALDQPQGGLGELRVVRIARAEGGLAGIWPDAAVPAGASHWDLWGAIRAACDQAGELAQARYAAIMPQLDELAAELLTAPEYRQASSAAARK